MLNKLHKNKPTTSDTILCMENLALIFVAIFLGMLFKRISTFPKDTAITLNLFVIYASLPALILLQVPKLEFSSEVLIPVTVPWAIMGLSALLVLLIGKMFQWDKKTIGALLMVAVLGNTSFVGVPLVTAYYGAEYVPYALIYDQTTSFVALATYGAFVTAYYGEGGDTRLKGILKKILTFPPFLSLHLAFLLSGTTYPPLIESVLEGLAATLVPLALVAVGYQLTFSLPKEEIPPFTTGLLIKLLFAPFIAWVIISMIGGSGMVAKITIFEAGMGPMITAGAMAILSGLAPRLTAAILGIGILVSFLTLPILHTLLKSFP